MRVLIFAAALALASCADRPPASTPMRDGPAIAAPGGWLDYCARPTTDDPRCRPS